MAPALLACATVTPPSSLAIAPTRLPEPQPALQRFAMPSGMRWLPPFALVHRGLEVALARGEGLDEGHHQRRDVVRAGPCWCWCRRRGRSWPRSRPARAGRRASRRRRARASARTSLPPTRGGLAFAMAIGPYCQASARAAVRGMGCGRVAPRRPRHRPAVRAQSTSRVAQRLRQLVLQHDAAAIRGIPPPRP